MAAAKKKRLTNKDRKLALAKRLEGLASGVVRPEFTSHGICENLKEFAGALGLDSYDIVPAYAIGWPRHSGSPVFPVPRNSSATHCWRGKYGNARKELCLYMAKKLRSEVRKGIAKFLPESVWVNAQPLP